MGKKYNWPNVIACTLFLFGQEQAFGNPFENSSDAIQQNQSSVNALVSLDSMSLHQANKLDTIRADYRIFEPGRHLKGVPARYHKTIHSYVKHFSVRDRRLIREMQQLQPEYFPMYEANLRKYALPHELKYLSILESNLNPKAVSHCQAVGLWQFTKSTGKQYNLHQDSFRDERMDPDKSTEAACKYLVDLYAMFGDWPLVLAAYNCGPGTVRRAIRRSGNRTSYWQICAHLPRETRAYVPKFIALYQVMNDLPRYNFTVDTLAIPLSWDTIIVHKLLDIHRLANHLDLTGQALQQLNPALKRNIIPGDSIGYSIRIPADRKDCFAINRKAALDSASFITPEVFSEKQMVTGIQQKKRVNHHVKSGETLSLLAKRYKVTVPELRKWNHLKSNTLKKGQNLVVWQKKGKSMKYSLADKGE